MPIGSSIASPRGLDWSQLAHASAVEAARAQTSGSFGDFRAAKMKRRKPHYVEAVI
jgi:hypothetical protein